MKKVLITGSQGFVGKYLEKELAENGYSVTGLDIRGGDNTMQVDLLDSEQVKAAVKSVSPDIVIHLAGQANILQSWKNPQRTIEINLLGAMNLMEAVRETNPEIRLVLIGSANQYGTVGAGEIVLDEMADTVSQTPYAVSKKAQEEFACIYVRTYGMNICMTRSFNHSGAGQQEGFMIPDFAAGITRIENGMASELRVGNLSAKRDFTHVKDIARAYRLIAEKGRPGEIYNVGSGKTYSAKEILEQLCSMSKCPITVAVDPEKIRPSDIPSICCNYDKLKRDTGWNPVHTVQEILSDVLEYYRMQYRHPEM